MRLELEVPDELLADWGTNAEFAQQRLQLEFALHLYASAKVSVGRATEIAGVRRAAFENALASSGVLRNYSSGDLEKDFAWASG